MKRFLIFASFAFTFLLLLSFSLTASASGELQLPQFATPTPQPDGRIIYIVQEGQTCTQLSLLTGIPVDQIRALNRLDENCTLSVGQELLLGVGGPGAEGATPEAGPAATATPGQPTPTPLPGKGSICILLYDDINGDSLRQDTENAIADGATSISGTTGQYSQALVTAAGTDPVCFDDVPEDTYSISVAAPEGYNPTTQLSYTIPVKAGDQIFVDFGAQKSTSPIAEQDNQEEGKSSILGIVGGGLVLLGAALGVYAWFMYGRKPVYNK